MAYRYAIANDGAVSSKPSRGKTYDPGKKKIVEQNDLLYKFTDKSAVRSTIGCSGGDAMTLTRLVLSLLACLWFSGQAPAQEQFYRGKTIRIIVGLSAGGGYDVYTRAVARHMGRHIPGNPAIVVENMVGAGSLIAANHVYKVAKPDGLTIGHFLGGLFLQRGHVGRRC